MKAAHQLQLQQSIIDYFAKIDNKTICSIIKCFVFNESTQDTNVSELIDKFISDNGLKNAFINYNLDQKNTKDYFLRSSHSDLEMMEQTRHAFLILAFNRFINLIDYPKIKKEKKLNEPNKIMLKYGDNDYDVHIVSDIDDNLCLCGNAIEGDFIKETILNVKNKVTCPNCLSIVKSVQKMKI